jgi:predicted N-acetyltransferase YhbS/RimJ/RimL family protein N-acetyltransferase/NAD(P)H-dependent FMN reductase
MNLIQGNLAIRNARPSDAEQLCAWWNDGKIMAHAGFPNGLNEQPEKIRESLAKDSDETRRRHIIEINETPIGEMNYNNNGDGVAEIGIKICNFTQQEKGLGTKLLVLFIDALFTYYGYEKIILDTNVKNERAQHVYENKLGFKRVRVRENSWVDQLGEPQSAVDYELTKAEWQGGGRKPPSYLHLRTERPDPDEHFAVEAVTREAHWYGNWEMTPQIPDTHLLVHRLRQCPSYVPELHYVAESDGKLVGHILYCTSKIVDEAGNTYEALTFGPLSTLPEYQNQGIGKALMRHTFGEAKERGYRVVLIFGHPDYYPRVGFKRASEFGITDADGNSYDPFMAYPLYEGALDGINGKYYIDPAYDNLTQDDIDVFDKKFPPKEIHIPISIDVLLDRLTPAAQKALEGIKGKSLMIMQTKSEHEIANMDGVDADAIKIIRTVMREHGLNWGNKKMRVCILMGSPRPKGNTAELCKPFIDELRQHQAEVEYITLHDKSIAPCLGCYRCQKFESEYACSQTDDMQAIIEKIIQADVLVFATPIYTWQATPLLKTVMDRMYGLNKFYGETPRSSLNKNQSYALIATCGYDLDYGAGLLDEGIRRWCAHSALPYLGMYAVRDEDDLASFQTDEAIQGARQFARRILEEA